MDAEPHPPLPKPRAIRPSPAPPKPRRRYIPGLWGWLLMLVVLGILAGLILPVFNSTCGIGVQTRSLSRAKQIGLALKIFASDHDDNYPRAGLPEMLGANPANSNAAFAALFPQYLTSETIFGNKSSAYQTRTPDNLYDAPYTGHPDKTLAPGENVWSYVAGLTERSTPTNPLVADGTDGTGHYLTDAKKRGGVWEGKKAIVVHLDNSGTVETLAGPDNARYIPRRRGYPQADGGNLLDVSGVGAGVRLLDPAVDPVAEGR